MTFVRRALALSITFTAVSFAAGWDARLAAEFLDGRQKQWFEWKPSQRTGGPCVSCHTGLTYLLARPALRAALRESAPAIYEQGLTQGFKIRLEQGITQFPNARGTVEQPSTADGVDAVLGMFTVVRTCRSAGGGVTKSERAAIDRLWKVQNKGGADRGAWPWFNSHYHPYESEHSNYFGAALAAIALADLPQESLNDPADQNGLRELKQYLQRAYDDQPLHNRLMAMWAAVKYPELMSDKTRESAQRQLWKHQRKDGSWTADSLGSWSEQNAAPSTHGKGSAYATALATFIAQETGVAGCATPQLKLAMEWLVEHQDPKSGAWNDVSMNKPYPPQSMAAGFMTDAATAFAAMSLLKYDACR